jgi:hypothetical protein
LLLRTAQQQPNIFMQHSILPQHPFAAAKAAVETAASPTTAATLMSFFFTLFSFQVKVNPANRPAQ